VSEVEECEPTAGELAHAEQTQAAVKVIVDRLVAAAAGVEPDLRADITFGGRRVLAAVNELEPRPEFAAYAAISIAAEAILRLARR
jgi:hypothetical protein